MASIKQRDEYGTWQARVRVKGKTYTKTFRTRALADEWARKKEHALRDKGEALEIGSGQLKFSDLMEWYRDEVAGEYKGEKQMASHWRRFERRFGALTLDAITPNLIADYIKERRQDVGPDTIRREMSDLSVIFKRAIARRRYFGANPVGPALDEFKYSSRLLGKPNRRERRLEPGEYALLMRGARHNPRLRQIIRLCIETGLRRGDVVNLRPHDLVRKGLWIRDDKGGNTVIIPISRRARRIIEQNVGPNGLGVRPDSVTQAFIRARRRVGLDDLRFHDLRHEGLSRLFEKGLTAQEVAMISRHKSWRMLERYTHMRHENVTKKLG